MNPHEQFPIATGPVTVCQLQPELDLALDMYRQHNPKRVLEIGTASGGSLYHWLQNSTPGTRIVTVDLPIPDYESSEHLYPDWTPEGVTVTQIRGNSHHADTIDACRLFGPYDLVFIDGAHPYPDARQDYDNYAPMCVPGGLVMLHDIALRRDYGDGVTAGVWQLWRELQAEGLWTRELRADPRLTEYGIGIVRPGCV